MGILKYFLYILFPAFVAAELARVQLTSFLGVTLFEVLVGVFVGVYLIGAALKKKRPVSGELVKPVCFVIGAFFLSLLVNIPSLDTHQLFLSSLYLVRWIVFIMIIFILLRMDKAAMNKFRELMLFAGSAVVVLGYLQLLFFNRLVVLFSLGWDEHYLRLFSTFLDPNFVGMFLVLFLLFLLPFLFKSLKQNDVIKKGAWIILSGATILAIILTYSRGAYVMLAIGLPLYLFLYNRRKEAIISVVMIVLLIAFFANTKIEGLNPFRVVSTKARIESMQNAGAIIKDHPLFGVGFNAYRYAQIEYGFRKEITLFPTHADSGTDNSFLFVLATSGIVGLAAYIFLFYSMLKKVRTSQSIFRTSFIVSLVIWCVGSLFINGLFYPFLLFWMWSLYAVTGESP